MRILHQKGYAINKKADAIVNSANGLMLLGTSGAGKIREKSEKLKTPEKAAYNLLLRKLPKEIRHYYTMMYDKHNWEPRYAQMSSMRLLLKNGGPFRRGTAILDKGWSKHDRRKLIHAIALTYDPATGKRKRASEATIRKAATEAIKIALSEKAKSIAIPVMDARKKYGVTPSRSLKATLSGLKKFGNEKIKVIICFDNPRTAAYLDSINKRAISRL
ncbi:hypothetical protein JW968_03185 [Candidatus Woesearchaeota archaeon]|nr:hypothetical protein [Candidatus Woesearchaeota archaeon]